MNTNEQQAQRDKLIELAREWALACNKLGLSVSGCDSENLFFTAEAAAKAFRDYVEHMHDEKICNGPYLNGMTGCTLVHNHRGACNVGQILGLTPIESE